MKIETRKKRTFKAHEETVIVLESFDEIAFMRDIVDAYIFTTTSDELQPTATRERFVNDLKALCESKLKE